MGESRSWRRLPRRATLVLLASVVALTFALARPPLLAFEAQPQPALALVILGALAALVPGRRASVGALRLPGAVLLWSVVLWCVLSQPISLADSAPVAWSQRAAPIVLLAALWFGAWLPRAWQQRTTAALGAPTLIALLLAGWASAPQVHNFQPLFLAIDSHQTLYVSDRDSSVIRVFGPDGALRAKLWPGLARRQGAPGPGFSPAGPLSDPDRLGISSVVGANATGVASVAASRADPFQFCGLAVDHSDRLYVPDPKHHLLLRFDFQGALQAMWTLPEDYTITPDCVTTVGDDVYLADGHGTVYVFGPDGQIRDQWRLPEAVGGISAAPDGTSIFALAISHVYLLAPSTGEVIASWGLVSPSGGILALAADRVLVGDHLHTRILLYCGADQVCAQIGAPGDAPGQFFALGGLARGTDGQVFVADYGHRVVERFTASGHIAGLYASVEDDEHE